MTFIGFNIDKKERNLIDQQTGLILEENIMSKQLWLALNRNNVPLQENFDDLSRYVCVSCFSLRASSAVSPGYRHVERMRYYI